MRHALNRRLNDDSGAVRVAAAEAIYQLGDREPALRELKRALNHRNHNTAFHAVRTWGSIGAPTGELLPLIRRSPHSHYEYIKRVATQLASTNREQAAAGPPQSARTK